MEVDEIANPIPAGFLGAHAVVAHTKDIAELATQSWVPAAIRASGYFSVLFTWSVLLKWGKKKSSEQEVASGRWWVNPLIPQCCFIIMQSGEL